MIKPIGTIEIDAEDPLEDSSELQLRKPKWTTWLCIIAYAFGCLMTNSYCQVYRTKEWKQTLDESQVKVLVLGATFCWPLYWASVLTQEAIKPEQ